MKKLLLKAVNDYHPDKVVQDMKTEEEHQKWKVFTETITQFITKYYERAKGFD